MATTLPDLVVPFRGERYTAADRLSRLIAPPYDVITPDERARYAALDPHNIVHVTLPEAAAGGDRYARAAERLATWRREAALRRDPSPAAYVMAQSFTLPGSGRRTRLGLFAAVAAEPYETRRIRPHERTHAGPKADRLALLRATATNLESIFLLAPDEDGALAAGLAAVASRSADVAAELDGVGIRLWVVTGDEARRLTAHCARRTLYIADGHHRFETAVAYAGERPDADRVLAFIVSVREPGLVVLPTHRVIYGPGRAEPETLIERWRPWFDVSLLAPGADSVARLAEAGKERPACIVTWPEGDDALLVLRSDARLGGASGLDARPGGRLLDVAVIETLVVQEILRMGTTPTLKYTADAGEAMRAVRQGGAEAAVLLNPTPAEQVLAVADAGGVMPPKSTYFVPKVPSGLVLRPLS